MTRAELTARLDARTPRERLILLALSLAVVWLLMDSLLISPASQDRTREEQRGAQLRTRLQAAENTLGGLTARPDPNVALRERIERLNQELTLRQEAADSLQNRLISPRDMPAVLEKLLAGLPGLRVAALKTLPPEPIGLDPNQKIEEAALYRHSVSLTLEGGYADMVVWLERVEKLPKGVFWTRADLDAKAHPDLRLTLEVATLSSERIWLTL